MSFFSDSNIKAPAGRSIDAITSALTIETYRDSSPALPEAPLDEEKQRALDAHRLGIAGGVAFGLVQNLDADTKGWQDLGNCLGVEPDMFFPERGASTREAKEVCKGCVVRGDCLEYALANGEKFGIWGGLSERERRRIRRQRSIEKKATSQDSKSVTG